MARDLSILQKLKTGGERLTPVRLALLDILSQKHEPQTTHELGAALAKRGLHANKTTVYRQLETLEQYGIVQEINLADRAQRYELIAEEGHHHHLVCLTCGRIEDVAFATDIESQEKLIWKKNKFKVARHSLEFFGTCQSCQKR